MLQDVAQKALDAGIKVVAYDVNLDNPAIPQIEQSDADMARLVLEQAIKDKGDGFVAGAVYVAGFAPLDRRYAVWKDFVAKHNLTEKAVWGVVNDTVPASVADQTKAVLTANPDISVIFTPWDEFAKGVKLAVDELGLSSKVKIYGVDISTADIQLITEPDSAWVATAATNAAVVGEVSVRAVSLVNRRPGSGPLGSAAADADHPRRPDQQQDRHDRGTAGQVPGLPQERRGDRTLDSGRHAVSKRSTLTTDAP